MAQVDPSLQSAIQAAVQPKLMENGWVVEENDTTLSEYVTMMIVNGKDHDGVKQELGGDLLGVGEDDPAVGDFAQWLFNTVNQLHGQQQNAQPADAPQQDEQAQPIPTVQDSQMEDSSESATAQPPTGPKSMRNGTAPRGRGGRMLGQMNRQMDRQNELPDNLRKIRGAAGGQSGRINAHSARDSAPRGPRNNSVANGVQRMMNGGGRGGHGGNMNGMNMMNGGGTFNNNQQMQFMQMMEASAQMMAQVLQQNGGVNMNGGFQQRGGLRGGRGGRGGQRGGASAPSKQLHAVDGKLPDAALTESAQDTSMDLDSGENAGDKFSTMCRFNLSCTIPTCPFAHQSPAAPPNTSVDLADTCTHGAACTNHKCSGRHPSPAQKNSHQQDVECKYYPNCTNPRCPFRHPTEKPCKFGDACTNANCTFAHPKIMCRYNPCLNPTCQFKHSGEQKRGKFQDKVWTADGEQQGEGGKAERFADFSNQSEGKEELIIPGQQQQEQHNGENGQTQPDGSSSQAMETQIVT